MKPLNYDRAHSPAPTDPAELLRSIPLDSQYVNILHSRIEGLIDEIDPYLDAFSSTGIGCSLEIQQNELFDFVLDRRELLETAILLHSVRRSRVSVRSLYIGGLLIDLCETVRGGRRGGDLATLQDTATRLDPPAWARLRTNLSMLAEVGAQNWRRWPMPSLAREACEALDGVERSWDAAVIELRNSLRGGANRGHRRDPALRGAVAWHQTTRGLLARLGTRGGPTRVIIDYYFMILAVFVHDGHRSARGEEVSRASAELLILEIFGLISQFASTDEELERNAPHFLEQGETSRRKRIQRARLKVRRKLQTLISDEDWVEWVYLRLDHIVHNLAPPVDGSPGPAPRRLPAGPPVLRDRFPDALR